VWDGHSLRQAPGRLWPSFLTLTVNQQLLCHSDRRRSVSHGEVEEPAACLIYPGSSAACGFAKTFGFSPRRPLQLTQVFNHVRLRPIHRPNELAPHDPGAIDHVSLGKLERPIQRIAFLVCIAHRKQIHTVILQKSLVVVLINIHADSQDGHALGLHALLHLNQ